MNDNLVKYFKEKASGLNIDIADCHIRKFLAYMALLNDYNSCMNLTAITDDRQIILKHFLDSLTVLPFINNNKTIIDVGTGAGFPGVPLKILNDSINLSLLESQTKRVAFLEELVHTLCLENVNCVNMRAEEAGASAQYREAFDFAVSRAVAPLSVLCEYCLPLVKEGGAFIAMKGKDAANEIKEAENAVIALGGTVKRTEAFSLDAETHNRTIIVIEKTGKTPEKFPRRPGLPSKKPL